MELGQHTMGHPCHTRTRLTSLILPPQVLYHPWWAATGPCLPWTGWWAHFHQCQWQVPWARVPVMGAHYRPCPRALCLPWCHESNCQKKTSEFFLHISFLMVDGVYVNMKLGAKNLAGFLTFLTVWHFSVREGSLYSSWRCLHVINLWLGWHQLGARRQHLSYCWSLKKENAIGKWGNLPCFFFLYFFSYVKQSFWKATPEQQNFINSHICNANTPT